MLCRDFSWYNQQLFWQTALSGIKSESIKSWWNQLVWWSMQRVQTLWLNFKHIQSNYYHYDSMYWRWDNSSTVCYLQITSFLLYMDNWWFQRSTLWAYKIWMDWPEDLWRMVSYNSFSIFEKAGPSHALNMTINASKTILVKWRKAYLFGEMAENKIYLFAKDFYLSLPDSWHFPL